jgi:hypothetical protein
MKRSIPQFELPAVGEVFNLAMENAVDGERLSQEAEAAAQRQDEAKELESKQQPKLL